MSADHRGLRVIMLGLRGFPPMYRDFRWFPVETHTSSLPFVNYLRDRLVHRYVYGPEEGAGAPTRVASLPSGLNRRREAIIR